MPTSKFLHLKKWSEGIARRLTLSRLDRMDTMLLEIAGLWGDVDEFMVSRCDELRANIIKLAKELDESIDERKDRERGK